MHPFLNVSLRRILVSTVSTVYLYYIYKNTHMTYAACICMHTIPESLPTSRHLYQNQFPSLWFVSTWVAECTTVPGLRRFSMLRPISFCCKNGFDHLRPISLIFLLLILGHASLFEVRETEEPDDRHNPKPPPTAGRADANAPYAVPDCASVAVASSCKVSNWSSASQDVALQSSLGGNPRFKHLREPLPHGLFLGTTVPKYRTKLMTVDKPPFCQVEDL